MTSHSIPFQTIKSNKTPSINIPTPPSSSGSNKQSQFIHPSRRRGSTDSYTDNDDLMEHLSLSPYSPSHTRTQKSNNYHYPSSPKSGLVNRSHSGRSPRSPRFDNDSLSSSIPNDINFDVLSPISPGAGILSDNVEPVISSTPRSYNNSYRYKDAHRPPSRKNSTDSTTSVTRSTSQERDRPSYDGPGDQPAPIKLMAMPTNMIVPMPDRNGEMKHLLEFNKSITNRIKSYVGEATFAEMMELWCHTRRTEIGDHEWLRRSRYFIVEKGGCDERTWGEWCDMVGYDRSLDLTKDENGDVKPVHEYAEKLGHMTLLEEGEEE